VTPSARTAERMPAIADALREAIDAALPRLEAIDDTVSARRPAPDKWSPREIIGHLIDSATNNHARFVKAQFEPGLVFPGYAQEDWVRVQRYQDEPWRELLALWAASNRHIARVIAQVPPEIAERQHARHNLHEVAWTPVPVDRPATLAYFMADYVAHLEHHLRQIWAIVGDAARGALHFEGAVPILHVRDLSATIAYYTTVLGFHVEWDDPGGVASVRRDRASIMMVQGDQGHPGTWVWVGVSDARALHAELVSRGASIRQPPTNYRWSLELHVTDPDGNVLRMGSEPLPDEPMGQWLDMRGRRWAPLADGSWRRVEHAGAAEPQERR